MACLLNGSLCLGLPGQGRTLTAASLSQPDVQAAVDAAMDGDTVKLPAGTATWTAGVTVNDTFISIRPRPGYTPHPYSHPLAK